MQSIYKRYRRSPKANWVHALFLLGLVSHASTAIAQTPGIFTPSGNMVTARLWHTATLLADGRVLIAGGVRPTFGDSVASAELYDPATGAFISTGNMITARLWHTATLLPDGKVLIVGGSRTNTGAPVRSAEIYDPPTGTFTATGTMITAQIGHRATLLGNGKVLIVGGIDAPTTVVRHFANPELYDPSTGLFASTGTYASANHEGDGNGDVIILATTTTLLADGRVLVLWGIGPAELYDPAAYTFSPTGASTALLGRGGFPATLLMNGTILVAGGSDGGDGIDASGTYDSSTGTFTATGNMTLGRYLHTATLLPDGTVLIVGGYGVSPNSPLAKAELYDPATGTFSTTGGMTTARGPHAATLLNNGKVLITGGGVSSTELYDPAVLVPAPVLFSLSGDAQGQGAIQHAGTYRIASSSDPAIAGEALTIYATGLAKGSVIPPQVAIGGRLAEIMSFGNTPGYRGLNYVNVKVPSDVVRGPAVSVRLTYIDRPSNQVTIGVQ